jgi:large subunit ribosomal protein L35
MALARCRVTNAWRVLAAAAMGVLSECCRQQHLWLMLTYCVLVRSANAAIISTRRVCAPAFRALVFLQQVHRRRLLFCAMQALASSRNGIAAAPKLAVQSSAVRPAAVSAVTVEAHKKGGRKKAKTRKAAAKRFKVSSSGKVLMRQAGKQHLNEKMSADHERRKGKEKSVFAGDVRYILNLSSLFSSAIFAECGYSAVVLVGSNHYIRGCC